MQDLPNEIVLEISRYLEGIDLGRFSMVNKEFYELLEKGIEEVKKIIKENYKIIFRIKMSKDGSFERDIFPSFLKCINCFQCSPSAKHTRKFICKDCEKRLNIPIEPDLDESDDE